METRVLFSFCSSQGTLTKHLKEIQETATKRVNQIIEELKEKPLSSNNNFRKLLKAIQK